MHTILYLLSFPIINLVLAEELVFLWHQPSGMSWDRARNTADNTPLRKCAVPFPEIRKMKIRFLNLDPPPKGLAAEYYQGDSRCKNVVMCNLNFQFPKVLWF